MFQLAVDYISLIDRINKSKKINPKLKVKSLNKTTQELLGITDITEANTANTQGTKSFYDYIHLKNGDYAVFFRIQPKNISAMPEEKLIQEIESFETVLDLSKYSFESFTFSSYQKFDDQIEYYKSLIEINEEENRERVKQKLPQHKSNDVKNRVLKNSINYLKEINATRSGAKMFYFILKINIPMRKIMDTIIKEFERLLHEAGFFPRIADYNELKEIIGTYLEDYQLE